MENPCKILCFGDSLTRGYAPVFEERFKQKFADINATIINAGVGGETSRDGLQRLPRLLEEQPQVVLIGFGMNDQAKGITIIELANNLSQMISAFENIGARIQLLTMNPVQGSNSRVNLYNQTIKDVAHEKRVRIIDVNSLWKREIKPQSKGLRDGCHPNELGNELYCKALLRMIDRRSTIILWQYNGNPAQCNYKCQYCIYDGGKLQIGHHFQGTIEKWRNAIKDTFGNQHLVLYFGHGEPMIGKRWFDVVEMVGDEPNWEMRVISNISPPLTRLLNSRVARDGRLNINASFHPTQTTKEKFLDKLLQCRECGIEVPIVYTLWPPFFERFEDDFKFFSKHNFLIHVRRFRGSYKNEWYPQSYTEEERRFVAQYADDITIKYMLAMEPTDGKLSWAGVDFMIMDNKGNIGYCDDYNTNKHTFGNIFEKNVKLYIEPQPFPKVNVSDGTVDGVASILELGYEQLEKNHIIHFSRKGGVYHTPNGILYKNMYTNFDDPRVRAEYCFPPRNFIDSYHILRCTKRNWNSKRNQIMQIILPERIYKLTNMNWRSIVGERFPAVKRLYRQLHRVTHAH